MPELTTLGRLMQKDLKFEASLNYTVRLPQKIKQRVIIVGQVLRAFT
jgi:hypothetical protein